MSTVDDRSDIVRAHAGRERIMEILVFLLTEMRAKKALTEIDLQPLSNRGFSQTEISAAFSWLFDKLADGQAEQEGPILFASPATNASSYRIYHEVERSVISAEARGYLLQLHELGLMNDFDLEFVIDRIMMAGVPSVSLEDVRQLVTSTVLGFDEYRSHGSRLMLTASDRIQ